MADADDLRSLVALNLVPGLGPRLTTALLARFGSAGAVLEASPEQLTSVPHIGAKLAQSFHQAIRQLDLDKELELIDRHEVRLLVRGTAAYPTRLAELADAPQLLYLRGGIEPADAKAVAIVGSRHCTSYGKRMAERLAVGLVQKGYTVVSGLARGIDAAAHRGALQAGGRTLAILAGGLSKIYPPEHEELARDIEKAGALLTESAMSMQPLAGMFPARNRIISGLALAVVIVEAAEKSGALITARHAAEQGRILFAVPGPVDSAASTGTNHLIREGAILIRHAADIIEDIEGIVPVGTASNAEPVPAVPPPGLDELQLRLWELLAAQACYLDELVRRSGVAVPQVSGALMAMEMKKIVRRLPGNRYERC